MTFRIATSAVPITLAILIFASVAQGQGLMGLLPAGANTNASPCNHERTSSPTEDHATCDCRTTRRDHAVADESNPTVALADRILQIAADDFLPQHLRRAIVIGELKNMTADQPTVTNHPGAEWARFEMEMRQLRSDVRMLMQQNELLANQLRQSTMQLQKQNDQLALRIDHAVLANLQRRTPRDTGTTATAAWVTNERSSELDRDQPAATVRPNPVPNLDNLTQAGSGSERPRVLAWRPGHGYQIIELPAEVTRSGMHPGGDRTPPPVDDYPSALDREIEMLDQWLSSLDQHADSMRARRDELNRRRRSLPLEPMYSTEKSLRPLPPESSGRR